MKAASSWRGAAFLLLAVPAALRALVAVAPNPFFAVDPRTLAIPLEGLGPAGSVVLDAMSLLGCIAALTAELIDRRPLDLRLLLLLLIPVPVLTWHGWDDAEQARVASQWLGAMATAVGAAHLSREARWRIVLLGAVVSLTIPLAVKGLYQVLIEHADTMRTFEENRAAVLESQGWEEGSSQAEIYLRRLSQREATGWFALSNVYGSVLAALGTFWVGASLAAARSKMQSGWVGVIILIAAAALAGLTASFSKGAAAAALAGLALAALCLLPRRWKQHLRPLTAWLSVVLLASALLVTALRGSLFPESLQGVDGYSLLFRWHYWVGAGRMFIEHPFAGVGPAGFQSAYLVHRPPLSPEEVASPHSVFLDWLAGGGVSMAAWIVLTLILLRRAAPSGTRLAAVPPSTGEGSGQPTAADEASTDPAAWRSGTPRFGWMCGAGAALLAGGAAWWLNRRALLLDYHALLMPLSLAAMAATFPLVEHLVRHASLGMIRWAVWAALTAALLHGQVEMTLTQPGSSALLMLLLGTASARFEEPHARDWSAARGTSWFGAGALIVTALAQVTFAVAPIVRTQHHLRAAHDDLAQVGEVRHLLDRARRSTDLADRLDRMREAESRLSSLGLSVNLEGTWREIQAAVQLNDGPRVQRLVGLGGAALDEALRRLEADRVAAALLRLEKARLGRPLDRIAWRKSSELWMHIAHLHAQADDAPMRDEAARTACALAEELAALRPRSSFAVAAAARRWIERWRLAAEVDALEAAIRWQGRLVSLDPNGLEAHRTLAELLDEAGRGAEAAAAYERTLEISTNMRLDPLKQLGDSQRRAIEERLAALKRG